MNQARSETPRKCGEKLEIPADLLLKLGSPRVCGEEVLPTIHAGFPHRITPACAGKKLPLELFRTQGEGITPACAGKSHVRHLAYAVKRDHPRVCGEKLCK